MDNFDHTISNTLASRSTYADALFERLPSLRLDSQISFEEVSRWRGLMFRDDNSLHLGSTPDDRMLAAQIMTVFGGAADQRAGFSAALASEPPPASGEVGIFCSRSKSPFFSVKFSPARCDARVLDPGVALLVKVLPLVSVWTWCSCDGHHHLGHEAIHPARPARIWLADQWYARWFREVLELSARHIALRCQWTITDDRYPIVEVEANCKVITGFDRSVEQDCDMQRLARFLLREEVNMEIQRVKAGCWRAKRLRGPTFERGLKQLRELRFSPLTFI